VLIKHYYLRKKTISETKAYLDKYYADSVPLIGTIHKWFTEFRCGRTSTVDAERSGRPKEVTTPENVEKIHDMMLNDPKVKLREVANAVCILLERVGNIVHSVLGMKKLCARWVPRLLTVDQKRIPKLHEIGFELVPQPPHSPDLASSDYYLFPKLNRWLTGKRFYLNEELIAETEAYFGDLPIEYFSDGIKKLENRWTRCIDLKGEYVEK
ncbi:histone-lysine N-methyltransferase SETMAR-like, partial [Belonocnema kinseyi]|uniref:histone-lysine N-methyltransferase SETMAR-like n=1 Tax=Belonocnema kinseyi TaxID=2817044 RepID=UPI00143DB2DD